MNDIIDREAESEETSLARCRELLGDEAAESAKGTCRREGVEILERFKEEGESAKTEDRTELQRLLAFLPQHQRQRAFPGGLQLDPFRAGQVRPLCTALAPEVARHFATVCDRAD